MSPQDYLHERDLYYVVDQLQRQSMSYPKSVHTYKLAEHRSMRAPRFQDQRSILRQLAKDGLIRIVNQTNKAGENTTLSRAWTYYYTRVRNTEAILIPDPLDDCHSELILKITNADLNHASLTQRAILRLHTDGEYIYVVSPYGFLRVNKEPMRPNSNVQILFDYLINIAKGKPIDSKGYMFPLSRGFEDTIVKKGFKGILRKKFLPVLDKHNVQLLTEVEMNIKESTAIYRELAADPFNQTLYDNYTAGIE